MKQILILFAAIFSLCACQKEDPQRAIYGTWYCKIDESRYEYEDKEVVFPAYLELYINKGSNTATITPKLTDLKHYWNEGSGTYTLQDGVMLFDFFIDVPPAHSWWPHASRKIIRGEVMPKAVYPVLKLEIESTIGEEVKSEALWFRRENPLLD